MNKMLTKLTTTFIGMAMAIGVGVAVSMNNKEISPAYADNDISISETTTGTSYTSTNFNISSGGATNSNYYKLGSATFTSKDSYNIDSNKNISYSIKTRKFNGPTAAQAVVNLSLLNGSTTVATASFSPTNTTLTSYAGTFTVTGDTSDVKFVIQGNGTNGGGTGVGISEIKFTATSSSGGGGGGDTPSEDGWVINTTNFDKPGSGTGYTPYNGEHTLDDIKYQSNQVMIQTTTLQFQKNTSYLYNTTSFGKITKITLGDGSNLLIRVNNEAFSGRNTTTGSSATSGSAISGTNGYFLIYDNGNTATCTSIKVEHEEPTYTVTYDDNGATNGSVPTDSTDYESGATVTVKGNTGNLTKTGYTFGGWNTKADGSGTNYAAGTGTFDISENTTLYAKWNDAYRVTYDANGATSGSVPTDSTYYDNGTTVTVKDNTGSLAKTNYEFGGWNTKADGTGTNYTAGTGQFSISSNIILYAKWIIASYVLTYDANGGSNAPDGDTVDVDDADSYTLAGLGSMSRENYTCDGWATSADGAKVYDLGESGVDLTQHAVDTAVTLYAHWVINSIAVTDDIEDGAPSVSSVDYGSSPEITINPDGGFTYPASVTVTMGQVELVDGEDFLYENGVLGVYIEVTATLKISGSCREIFTVTADIENGGLDNKDSIVQGEKFEGNVITIDDPDEYTYPSSITITMDGVALTAGTDYEYDPDSGVILSDIVTTGDIVISGECELIIRKDIEVSLTNGSKKSGASKLYDGRTAELILQANEHYKLPTSIEVIGATLDSYTQSTGVVVISNLVTTAEKVVISGSCVALKNNDIETSLTGVTADSGNATEVEEGSSVTLTFTANDNYALPETITVTGAASYTWTKSTGKLEVIGGTSELISITINGVARALTSISLSSSSGSYTLGDEFEMPTVTANFNFGEPENVTSSATATGSGLVNGIFTATGVKEITISYTYAEHTETATYTATVTAITPAAAGLTKVTSVSELTVGSTVYLVTEKTSNELDGISTTSTKYGTYVSYSTKPNGAYPLTVGTGSSDGTYSFANSSGNYLYWGSGNSLNVNGTLNENTSWNVTISSGNATITNVNTSSRRIVWNAASGQGRFAAYGSPTVDDTGNSFHNVQLYKYTPAVVKTLKWITAEIKSDTYYQGDTLDNSYFTVTAHYDDGTISTPTTGITVTNGYLENIGDNQVTISYSGKSCFVNVEAEERTAEYTGLSWDQGEYILIDGQEIDFSQFGTVTAEYDDGESPSATKAISVCTVAIYTKNGESYSKVGDDLSDGDVITSASHGKYLGVTYTETNTFTAYSSAPIYVVEEIESVYHQVKTYTWEKVSSISVGDTIVMTGTKADGTEPYELTGVSDNIGVATSFDSNPSGTFALTVVAGKNDGEFAFMTSDGDYLSYSADKKLSTSGTLNSASSWTVTFDTEDNTKAVVTNCSSNDPLQYNPGSRFCVYASKSQQPIKFYKGEASYVPEGEDIANTDVIAQKVVLEYAEHFNDVMECIQGGTTSNVSGKWSDLADDFDNWFNNGDKDLTPEQLEDAFALFANAYAVEGGDTLQDMLARYEYICAKYKLDDFLATSAERPAVAKRTTVLPGILVFNIANNGENILLVIATLTLVAFAFGGYTYFRKKKQF